MYKNHERKRSWEKLDESRLITPIASFHPKELMLCVGMVILESNHLLHSEKYKVLLLIK